MRRRKGEDNYITCTCIGDILQVWNIDAFIYCHNVLSLINFVPQFSVIRNSYITGPSFVADLLHRKSAWAIARGLLRAINRLQNEGT